MWTQRHLLGIESLSSADIDAVLDRAETWHALSRKPEKKASVLRGRTVINLFFEASTRTRTSFEIAGKRLGADVVNVSSSGSSVTKGETLLDTAKNLEAMQADLLVVRHASSGACAFLAERLRAAVVNAGDGAHEHPTQALLDAFTIRRAKGRLDGLVIAICGDIAHSRVARSNAILFGKKGAEVRFCAPKTMMPPHAESLGPTVSVIPRLEDAVRGADVVMMLRIQHERLAGAMMSTTREYSRTFGLGPAMLANAKPDAIVMHPGPINRGVELDPRVADGSRSVILDQVEAGVAVRMAVLDLLLTPPAEG
ncbi:Aspartate carbamoyltransferase [Labilithrix luteola]|uniref:Aspartate carbamoyltransferase n=1 Tax=Labilithrix luteola TaxID=1391654 RepID=A0A0K1Q6Q5_9BACT|nr:aspartate carbamoyltransferase catalytic subunit [Labilithrix luteola]AKV01418.1 Aspartate carbamoyltransferase [Labilithrix luteola]